MRQPLVRVNRICLIGLASARAPAIPSTALILGAMVLGLTTTGCERSPQLAEASSTVAQAASPEKTASQPQRPNEAANSLPDFEKLQVVGRLGNGVAAALLRGDGRDLTGSPGDHDALLIDSSAMPAQEVVAAIKQALSDGKYIVVDGSDTAENATSLTKIMLSSGLIASSQITAYAVGKTPDGQTDITPLHSLKNEKGERPVDQLHNVLNVKKPPN
jgi:hypothetical protein